MSKKKWVETGYIDNTDSHDNWADILEFSGTSYYMPVLFKRKKDCIEMIGEKANIKKVKVTIEEI